MAAEAAGAAAEAGAAAAEERGSAGPASAPPPPPHRRTYSNGGAAANGARHSRAANGDELSELSAKIVAQRRRASSARLSPVAGNGARTPTPTRREWWAACLPCWAG